MEPKARPENAGMPLDQTILNHIADLGFEVVVEPGAVTTIDKQTDDRHRVTFDHGDRYRAACKLARLVGVELED